MLSSTVAIMHPYPLVLGALSSLFNNEDRFNVIHICLSYEQLFSAVSINKVDLVVIDIETNTLNESRITMFSRLLSTRVNTKIVILIDKIQNEMINTLKDLGVSAIVSKKEQSGELLSACDRILALNEFYVSEKIKDISEKSGEASFGLSDKEMEIIKLIVSGHTLAEVAELKNRSLSTISTHKYNAMRKLGLGSNAELMKFAYENHLLS
ncbi:response regulator transcription factor [Paramixta manurensis]|uniref:Response regulator transcription factor n=1 Tax=Paramixta manurensis TaxID=2740817 RepID=A0A6M8UGZ7_9GAMM|nr:response regulator transcription factor [Erwiniaceae bacterium PD-1]